MKLFYIFIILLVVVTTGFSVTNNNEETETYSVDQVIDQKTFVELLQKGEPFDVFVSRGKIIRVYVNKNPLLTQKVQKADFVLSEETDPNHKAVLIENDWLKTRNDSLRDKVRELMREKEEWKKQKCVVDSETVCPPISEDGYQAGVVATKKMEVKPSFKNEIVVYEPKQSTTIVYPDSGRRVIICDSPEDDILINGEKPAGVLMPYQVSDGIVETYQSGLYDKVFDKYRHDTSSYNVPYEVSYSDASDDVAYTNDF